MKFKLGALFGVTAWVLGVSAHAQAYKVVELGTLSQDTPAVVHGPNLTGAAVGGGTFQGSGAAGQRRGVLFQNGTARHLPGLPSSDVTTVFAISDSGRMAGSANAATAVRAFSVTPAGVVTQLPPLGGDSATEAYGVNNIGQAVGFSSGPGGQRAVLWDAAGAARALPPAAGSTASRAIGINDRADVVGVVNTQAGQRPVVWPVGMPPTLLALLVGQTTGEATAINARGDIVGFTSNASAKRRAMLWPSNGTARALGILPGGDFSQAFGVNALGDVVGASNGEEGNRAVIWARGGAVQDLNRLIAPTNFVLTKAVGINDVGMILAVGHDAVAGHSTGLHMHQDEHDMAVRVFLLTRSGGTP